MFNMILGPVIFNSNEGIIAGSTLNASPTSTSKVVSGSGGFNTGFSVATNNGVNITSSVDPDVTDSNVSEVV